MDCSSLHFLREGSDETAFLGSSTRTPARAYAIPWIGPGTGNRRRREIGLRESLYGVPWGERQRRRRDGRFFLIEAQPADLTQLSKKNDGRFPFWQMYRVIDGRAELRGHGTREMPIWGAEFRLEESGSPAVEAAVRGQILQLIHYLRSIQEE